MTGLRTWRRSARNFILISIAWEVAATIASLALLIFVTIRGGVPSPNSLISIFGTLGLYGIVIWAIRDAEGRRRQRPLERVATVEEEASP